MKKTLAFCLVLMLLFSVSARAEYEQYRLTADDTPERLQLWEVYPLDPHNVIVRSQTSQAWHVTWYRDGQVYRLLSSEGDWDSITSAEPVFESGSSFYMICRIPSDLEETAAYPPPNAAAQWTDSGLVNKVPLAERVKATRWGNRILVYETDQYHRICYNGKETVIPRKLADCISSSNCVVLADEVFLMTYRDPDAGESKLICLDHGNGRAPGINVRREAHERFFKGLLGIAPLEIDGNPVVMLRQLLQTITELGHFFWTNLSHFALHESRFAAPAHSTTGQQPVTSLFGSLWMQRSRRRRANSYPTFQRWRSPTGLLSILMKSWVTGYFS